MHVLETWEGSNLREFIIWCLDWWELKSKDKIIQRYKDQYDQNVMRYEN